MGSATVLRRTKYTKRRDRAIKYIRPLNWGDDLFFFTIFTFYRRCHSPAPAYALYFRDEAGVALRLKISENTRFIHFAGRLSAFPVLNGAVVALHPHRAGHICSRIR